MTLALCSSRRSQYVFIHRTRKKESANTSRTVVIAPGTKKISYLKSFALEWKPQSRKQCSQTGTTRTWPFCLLRSLWTRCAQFSALTSVILSRLWTSTGSTRLRRPIPRSKLKYLFQSTIWHGCQKPWRELKYDHQQQSCQHRHQATHSPQLCSCAARPLLAFRTSSFRWASAWLSLARRSKPRLRKRSRRCCCVPWRRGRRLFLHR